MDIDLDTLPLDDQDTWDLISDGNVVGCFQIESRLGRQICKQVKPQNINELADVIALMRPSCLSADSMVAYCIKRDKRRNNHESFDYKNILDINPGNQIVSYNPIEQKFFPNKVTKVFDQGTRDTYAVNLINNNETKNVLSNKLKCTLDHKLLTSDGWKKLIDIKKSDRIAISAYKQNARPKGSGKAFRNRCFSAYKYKCIFCDWSEGSLDVNHIDGSRETDNSVENLCFMCPNHHRMFTEGTISVELAKQKAQEHRLPFYENINWASLEGIEFYRTEPVYDIEVEGPHHNFVANGVVVHNCLEAKLDDGKNIVHHYVQRKFKKEDCNVAHKELEPILGPTYDLLLYQEQSIKIGQAIGGMTLAESDKYIRKGIGKKKTDVIAEAKKVFISGAQKQGFPEDDAKGIFEWLEKGSRYQFNLSHAVSYAMNTYITAYLKAHHKIEFYRSYLSHAKFKQKPLEEVNRLVEDARKNGIDVYRPDLRMKNDDFTIINNKIYFGITNVKEIGDSVAKSILGGLPKKLDNIEWPELLFEHLLNKKKNAIKALIAVGALDYLGISREKMLYEHNACLSLTKKEQEYIIANCDFSKTSSVQSALDFLLNAGTGKNAGMSNKNRVHIVSGIISAMKNPMFSLSDSIKKIANYEESFLGISITCSKFDVLDRSKSTSTCLDFNKSNGGGDEVIIGQILRIKEIVTSDGQDMAFLDVKDDTDEINVVVFPSFWKKAQSVVQPMKIVKIHGYKSEDSFMLKKIEKVNE